MTEDDITSQHSDRLLFEMQQSIQTLKQMQHSDDRSMFLPSLVKLGPCTRENRLSKVPHP